VHDPVTIALKRRAQEAGAFIMRPSKRILRAGCPWNQPHGLGSGHALGEALRDWTGQRLVSIDSKGFVHTDSVVHALESGGWVR
jgi:hypothetical protein